MTLWIWFGFSGRLGRAKFWLVSATGLVLLLATMGPMMAQGTTVTFAVFGLGLIVILPMMIGAGIRRLHDRDRTGAWALLFYGTPTVIAAIGGQSGNRTVLGVLSLICVVLQIWGLVWLGALRGTPGPNRFGPDPVKE